MTTTALHPGCAFCRTCLYDGWGDETDEVIERLAKATVAKFHELARAATGDRSITWYPGTSEIMYECYGKSDAEGCWFDPLVDWPEDVDFVAILDEARTWVTDHAEEICPFSEYPST